MKLNDVIDSESRDLQRPPKSRHGRFSFSLPSEEPTGNCNVLIPGQKFAGGSFSFQTALLACLVTQQQMFGRDCCNKAQNITLKYASDIPLPSSAEINFDTRNRAQECFVPRSTFLSETAFPHKFDYQVRNAAQSSRGCVCFLHPRMVTARLRRRHTHTRTELVHYKTSDCAAEGSSAGPSTEMRLPGIKARIGGNACAAAAAS